LGKEIGDGGYGAGMAEVVLVGVVDERGWVLLQERDEHAPVDPERWTLPGGGVEAGESDAAAAHRELEEETGLRLSLRPLGTHVVACSHHGSDEIALFGARTSVTDADVVCGEGRQMVFVDPATLGSLDLINGARTLMPLVLEAAGVGPPERR
jgi:8-oxo-dGTP diphosphatase